MRRPNQIVTRAMLLEDVWNYKFLPQTNVVDVHIGNLRRKIDPAARRRLIVNVRAPASSCMWTSEVLRARAVRMALAFALAIAVATSAVVALIYLQVSTADVERVGALLVEEAGQARRKQRASCAARSTAQTPDLRRVDFVALFDARRRLARQFVDACRRSRPTGAPISSPNSVAWPRRRASRTGDLRRAAAPTARPPLGRSLPKSTRCARRCASALAIALAPMIVLVLVIGAVFARRATRRLGHPRGDRRNHEGRSPTRVCLRSQGDDIDQVARAVNADAR